MQKSVLKDNLISKGYQLVLSAFFIFYQHLWEDYAAAHVKVAIQSKHVAVPDYVVPFTDVNPSMLVTDNL